MCSASSLCRWASTPSLTRPGSTPRSWLLSLLDLVEPDPEAVLGLGVLDHPDRRDALGRLGLLRLDLRHRARGRHPVERLVGAAVGVDEDRAVGLDHEQPGRQRKVGRQPSVVVDAALRNHHSHRVTLVALGRGHAGPGPDSVPGSGMPRRMPALHQGDAGSLVRAATMNRRPPPQEPAECARATSHRTPRSSPSPSAVVGS